MRDEQRRKRILKLLEKIWKKYPDLRLCQMIGNCFPRGDIYDIKDKFLEESLRLNYLGKDHP